MLKRGSLPVIAVGEQKQVIIVPAISLRFAQNTQRNKDNTASFQAVERAETF